MFGWNGGAKVHSGYFELGGEFLREGMEAMKHSVMSVECKMVIKRKLSLF